MGIVNSRKGAAAQGVVITAGAWLGREMARSTGHNAKHFATGSSLTLKGVPAEGCKVHPARIELATFSVLG
jgi:hypothetical protein